MYWKVLDMKINITENYSAQQTIKLYTQKNEKKYW